MPDIGIMVLAAGASSRMGQPKQLLKVKDQSLIRHIIDIAIKVPDSSVVVVLGKYFDVIRKEIEEYPVGIVLNENWEQGMGASIKKGMAELLKHSSKIKAVIILLVDQALITPALLEQLIASWLKTNQKIIASKYNDTFGVPALFDAAIFPELLQLKNQNGAKQVIQKYMLSREVAFIEFPDGQFDLDTPEDYERFKKKL